MFTECAIKLINNHIVIDHSQKILIDTGSPVSFHSSGNLSFGENHFNVHSNIPSVSSEYLSEKVGCEIDGLMGMDIINRFSTLISLKDKWMFIDDDAVYQSHLQMFPIDGLTGGLLAITIYVNHQKANMIVDTGAPISYIQSEFLTNMETDCVMDDFSPFIGNFQTKTCLCEVDVFEGYTNQRTYVQRFGVPPKIFSQILDTLNVNGIIGVDLFKRFRLQIREGILYFPPQGI